MGNITKVVDGVAVTDTDVPPPQDWTNVYNEIGSDVRWNEDMEAMVKDRGLIGHVQPLFGTLSDTGEALFLMQVGGKDFIVWDAVSDAMYRVNGNLTLEKIVANFDERGMKELDLEEL